MDIEFPNVTEIEKVIFETALHRFGPNIRSSRKIAPAIMELSDYYNAPLESRGACPNSTYHQAARLLFFTLADMPKAYVTAAEADILLKLSQKARIKVLDLGVGYGAQSFGLLSYLFQKDPERRVQVDAVDRDTDALEAFEQVVINCQHSRLWGEVIVNTWRYDLNQKFVPRDQYDIIIIGNTVCELQSGVQYPLLTKLLSGLTDSGMLFVIEPALRATSRKLHRLRDQLLENGQCKIAAPCTRQENCPCLLNEKDWCHESRQMLLPPRCRQLAVMTGLRVHEIKWSYITVTRQHMPGDKYKKVWRVVSDLMKPKGKQEAFLCGTSGRFRAVLQKRDRTSVNRIFKKLHRGQFVWIPEGTVKDDIFLLGRESTVQIEDPVEHILI